MRKSFLLLFSLSVSFVSMAQNKRCHTDEFEQHLLKQNPELEIKKQKIEEQYRTYLESQNLFKQSTSSQIIHIPVVFHIVYKNNAQNLPDSRIMEQLDRLNLDYSGANADTSTVPLEFKPFIANTNLRFYLATTDPDGNPTTGITRTETEEFSFGVTQDQIKYTNQGGKDAWPTTQYLNIWVGNIEAGILGYATPPFNHGNASDGVVVGYRYLGETGAQAPFNKGRTAVHEVGHYLGLNHVWGPGAGGCGSDDGISDTPLQLKNNYGTPAYPQSSCGSSDMFMNYMDYCDDEALVMFSQGQRTKMENIATTTRSSLSTVEPVGINENNLSFTIYPNPSKGEVKVQLNSNEKESQIQIIDLAGRLQFNMTSEGTELINIDASHLVNGVYFVKITQGNKTSQQKIVIMK